MLLGRDLAPFLNTATALASPPPSALELAANPHDHRAQNRAAEKVFKIKRGTPPETVVRLGSRNSAGSTDALLQAAASEARATTPLDSCRTFVLDSPRTSASIDCVPPDPWPRVGNDAWHASALGAGLRFMRSELRAKSTCNVERLDCARRDGGQRKFCSNVLRSHLGSH
jgi:hypothetical protein